MVVLGIDAHKRTHTVVAVDEVGRRLVNEGFDVYELGSQAGSLETIFMEMVAPDAIAGDVRSLSAK